jgi:uncharacterized membrane protein YkvA (DUF1232 family)
MIDKLKKILDGFNHEMQTYQLVLNDERTPRLSKILLAVAIFYFISPIDLIPDFIPVIGHLDDLIIVPCLVLLALSMIPKEVVAECREIARSSGANSERSPASVPIERSQD